MEVKLETDYLPHEVEVLVAALVTSGLITQQEAAQEAAFFADLHISFFDVNMILRPFLHKFVSYWEEDRKVARHIDWKGFYTGLTLELPRAALLGECELACTIEEATDTLSFQVGDNRSSFCFLNHPEYLQRVVAAINALLQQHWMEVRYYEIGVGEDSVFLLLTSSQYQYLLKNRIIQFLYVEYPEVEAWCKSIREEDLPF